jgi:hypothetical protein
MMLVSPLLFVIGGVQGRSYEGEQDKQKAEAPKFEEAISAAMGCKTESLGHVLVYPLHSLVVYSPELGDGAAAGWTSEARRRYHYACPRDWLATAKENARLVVLVSLGDLREMGRYEPTGVTAFEATWNVVFVDVASKHIVAKAYIVERDPQSVGPLSVFERDHSSAPTEDEVVSAIRKTVSFTQ